MIEKTNSFNFKDNGFDLIRLICAILVMLHHFLRNFKSLTISISITYKLLDDISVILQPVISLLALSGFLIVASYERSKNRKDFYLKRVFRLFPELWVCTIVNFIVVCVLAYDMLDGSIFVWLFTQIFGFANTPHCLKSFATGSINGALWTVFVQIQFYVVLSFTYGYLKCLSKKQWGVLLAVFALCNIAAQFLSKRFGIIVDKAVERFFLTYALPIFIGVFCYLYREEIIPKLKKCLLALLILYFVLFLLPIDIGYYANIFTSILMPLIVIGFGYRLPRINFSCDLSYGIFIYHWIVLNVIDHLDLMNKLPNLIGLIIYFGLTITLAWLSWRFVGKGRKVFRH